MPKTCILPKQAEKLRNAFASGELSIEKLFNMTSKERLNTMKEYVGEASQDITAKLEKSFLMVNQKNAIKNWIFRNIADTKPLYNGVSLEQAEKLSTLKISELKKMSSENRIEKLSEFVDINTAKFLNEKFEALMKSGNLIYWEEKTFGTKELRENKKLKGSLSKLEMLNDMGVLNPKQVEAFMETFVEDKLGVNLTFEESQKLSELTQNNTDAFDKLIESGDWTANNEQEVLDYFETRKELEDYTESLQPGEKKQILNKLVDIFRANILGSPRILQNSALYQTVPGIERSLTKRLVSAGLTAKQLDGNFVSNFISEYKKTLINKEMSDFIKRQTKMAVKIYNKTGYDISRMETIEDGYKFFGEKVRRFVDKKTDTKAEKMLNKYGKVVNLAPKWFAGGTDTLFANIGRAETALIKSRQIAEIEQTNNELPKGMSVNERASELLKESYNFNTQDEKAQSIREVGIFDAHLMNNTQPDGYADKLVEIRNKMSFAGIKFGKALIPFAKISSTVGAEGIKTATGYGVVKSIYDIHKASKIENKQERIFATEKAVNKLVRYAGFSLAVFMLSLFLDNDDYVGAYGTVKGKEYNIAKARGAEANSIRIGGKWIPLRYLPIINITLSAIMTARQSKEKGMSVGAGYLKGFLGQITELPGIKEGADLVKKTGYMLTSKTDESFLKTMKMTPEDTLNYFKVRFVPSIVSYDIWNSVTGKTKYDFLGRETEKKTIINILKDDRTNVLLDEINRLMIEDNAPAISDPTGIYAKELEQKLGKEKYQDTLAELKREYAIEIEKEINKNSYKKADDNDKKSKLDSIRQREILDKLKKINKKTK